MTEIARTNFDLTRGAWLTDMDGVLIKEDHALEGAAQVIDLWNTCNVPYALLTNNSTETVQDLATRLATMGIQVPGRHIWTAAEATAAFLHNRAASRNGVFVIGDDGMRAALANRGIPLEENHPSAVVISDTRVYSYERIAAAAKHLVNGAGFFAASPDPYDPGHDGPMPSTGALCALLTSVTGRSPYVIGKPGAAMFRTALSMISATAEETTMIGDRLDTDILGGVDAGMRTVLVRSGVADEDEVRRHPIAPDLIVDSIAELLP